MKTTPLLPVIAVIAALVAPFSAQAKDKHDKHDDHHDHDQHDHDKHDHDKHHDSDHHDRFNRGPNISFHTYPYSYGYGGPGYYGSSYYYSRPRVGFSYYSSPSYAYRERQDVYRGRQVYSSYSDSLAADVQRELRRRGYYRGPLDGDIGPGSRAAIRAYQDDRGLSPTGRIDTSLLRSLGIG